MSTLCEKSGTQKWGVSEPIDQPDGWMPHKHCEIFRARTLACGSCLIFSVIYIITYSLCFPIHMEFFVTVRCLQSKQKSSMLNFNNGMFCWRLWLRWLWDHFDLKIPTQKSRQHACHLGIMQKYYKATLCLLYSYIPRICGGLKMLLIIF